MRQFSVENGDNIRVWLDSVEVTERTFAAVVPDEAGIEGPGKVLMFTTWPPTHHNGIALSEGVEGMVRWEPKKMSDKDERIEYYSRLQDSVPDDEEPTPARFYPHNGGRGEIRYEEPVTFNEAWQDLANIWHVLVIEPILIRATRVVIVSTQMLRKLLG